MALLEVVEALEEGAAAPSWVPRQVGPESHPCGSERLFVTWVLHDSIAPRPYQLTLGSGAEVDGFHPAVGTWFRRRFPDGPTEPQRDGVAAHRGRDRHARRGADRLGQDARRLPRQHQPPVPRARCGRADRERRARRLRVAAEGARGRHRREPRASAARDRRDRRASSGSTRPTSGSRSVPATRRTRSARDDAQAAELLRHDARVALPPGHERERTGARCARSRW